MKKDENPRQEGAPAAPQGVGGESGQGLRPLLDELKRRLEECRQAIERLESELVSSGEGIGEFVKNARSEDLAANREQPEPLEVPANQPAIPSALLEDDEETEGDKYLASIQQRIQGIVREELEHLERAAAVSPPARRGETMVCPSCGAVARRTDEICPQCNAPTEPDGGGGLRRFPLSAEKFLYVFNDRFGWFVRGFERSRHLADNKGEYREAANILKVLVQFMEENLDLLKSKNRDFKLALAYAYLGRSYFQAGDYNDAIASYKKGALLKASNSYNCEIGLSAVYRALVRQVRETGGLLEAGRYPALSAEERENLNKLSTSLPPA